MAPAGPCSGVARAVGPRRRDCRRRHRAQQPRRNPGPASGRRARRVNPRELASAHAREAQARLQMAFDDNSLLPQLFGEGDKHLERIERALGVALASRADLARAALTAPYDRLKRGLEVDAPAVDAALRMAPQHGSGSGAWSEGEEIRTRRRRITPRGPVQAQYVKALRTHDMVFGLGPAGTGKTYLAVAMAVDMLMSGQVERIILSRPAVEAGERLGFLPGDLKEKVDPYLRPLYDALNDMLTAEQVMK